MCSVRSNYIISVATRSAIDVCKPEYGKTADMFIPASNYLYCDNNTIVTVSFRAAN